MNSLNGTNAILRMIHLKAWTNQSYGQSIGSMISVQRMVSSLSPGSWISSPEPRSDNLSGQIK